MYGRLGFIEVWFWIIEVSERRECHWWRDCKGRIGEGGLVNWSGFLWQWSFCCCYCEENGVCVCDRLDWMNKRQKVKMWRMRRVNVCGWKSGLILWYIYINVSFFHLWYVIILIRKLTMVSMYNLKTIVLILNEKVTVAFELVVINVEFNGDDHSSILCNYN
jgi:hypothetical protein